MSVTPPQSGVPQNLPEFGQGRVAALVKKHMGFQAKVEPESKFGVRSSIGTDGAVNMMKIGGQANGVTKANKPPPPLGSSGLQDRVVADSGGSAEIKELGKTTLVSQQQEQVGADALGPGLSLERSVSDDEGSSGAVDSGPSQNEVALLKAQEKLDENKFIMEKSKAGHDRFESNGGGNEATRLGTEITQLEARVAKLEGKRGSQLRSIFPGGALKTARKELAQAKSDLGAIQKDQSAALTYKAAESQKPELEAAVSKLDLSVRIEKGNKASSSSKGESSQRTTISSELSGGISNPKTETEVKNMQKALVTNLTDLRASLITQVPRTLIDMNAYVGSAKVECSDKQNNYILHLDMHPNLTYDDATKKLALTDAEDGSVFEVDLSKGSCKVENGKIVIGESLMCDQASFSDETFGGHVRMASFNDGNGWGNASKGAAEKANEVALQKMEEGMRELVGSDQPITSQDIIRVQDEAMMAAHDAVVSDKPLGATCPQLMTVAGNTAHLSLMGDTKCFVIGADLSISDPTEGIRGGFDAKDPGGRIGGAKHDTKGYVEVNNSLSGADLRNYTHCTLNLKPGDTVIMCSDGVGDSLDPAMRGLTPEDCGLEGKEWDDGNSTHNEYRNQYQATQLKQILTDYKKQTGKDTLSSEDISKALNQFVHNQTLKRKMQTAATTGKEPESKKNYPGKMDHAGMLVYTHPKG